MGHQGNVDYRLILEYLNIPVPRKAYAAFEKALEIEPKNDEAKRAVKRGREHGADH